MSVAAAVHEKAITLSKLAVRMTAKAGSGHPSSALSLAHLVSQLMYRQMQWDPADPWNPVGDRLVLSEGHAVPIVYAAYADLGGIVSENGSARQLTVEDVDGLRARESVLDGSPLFRRTFRPCSGMSRAKSWRWGGTHTSAASGWSHSETGNSSMRPWPGRRHRNWPIVSCRRSPAASGSAS